MFAQVLHHIQGQFLYVRLNHHPPPHRQELGQFIHQGRLQHPAFLVALFKPGIWKLNRHLLQRVGRAPAFHQGLKGEIGVAKHQMEVSEAQFLLAPLGLLHEGFANFEAEEIPLRLKPRHLHGKDAPGAANVDVQGPLRLGKRLIPVRQGNGNLVFFTEWINVLTHPNNRHRPTYLIKLQFSIMPQPPLELSSSPGSSVPGLTTDLVNSPDAKPPASVAAPPPLQPGDRLVVVAPSGALRELDALRQGLDLWRSWGFELEVPAAVGGHWGYLAGRDEERQQAWMEALVNPDYRAILCARGGYGGARVLEQGPWPEAIHPKWLVGFSDITSLLWGGLGRGLMGLHGPLLTTLASEPEWSQQRLRALLMGQAVPALRGLGWGGGRVTGTLLPANLTVATHLLGTPYEPNLDGAILALEDVTEAPYRIDRMLTHWRMMGRLKGVKGIALGRFSRCEPADNVPSFTVEEVLRDRLGDLGIPIVSGLPFGHDGDNAALPVGVSAHLNGDQGTLAIL
jgi:muramoyltetrapeptide carboxypeptidase